MYCYKHVTYFDAGVAFCPHTPSLSDLSLSFLLHLLGWWTYKTHGAADGHTFTWHLCKHFCSFSHEVTFLPSGLCRTSVSCCRIKNIIPVTLFKSDMCTGEAFEGLTSKLQFYPSLKVMLYNAWGSMCKYPKNPAVQSTCEIWGGAGAENGRLQWSEGMFWY